MTKMKNIKMRLQFTVPEEMVKTVECMMCGQQGDKEFMKEHLQLGTQHHYITSSSFWVVGDENYYEPERIESRLKYRKTLQNKFEKRTKNLKKKTFVLSRFTVAEHKEWVA